MSRVAYLLAVVVVLLAAAAVALVVRDPDPQRELSAAMKALDYRPIEGRLAHSYDHRPYRRVTAAVLPDLWRVVRRFRGEQSARTTESQRIAGAGLLFAGRVDDAFSTFVELLGERSGGQLDVLRLIQSSTDAALLTDFSAAALERSGERNLLLAYEAADRAWQLSQSIDAAWNRAVAAQRIGMYAFAERAWREIAAREPDAAWAREAEARRAEAARRAAEPPPVALELFYYRDLFTRTRAGDAPADAAAGDRLASDTNAAVALLRTPTERQRLDAAIAAYLRGRDAVDRSEIALASEEYANAEAELDALRVPLAWIARDQRIRCDCTLPKPRCIESMRAFRREVEATGRYPWLVARTMYGEGQVLYRHGRVYEAAPHLEDALEGFRTLGDTTGVAQMHILLTNIYGAGGESELALRHYLQGLAFRTPAEIVDRRRRILEDGITFMLRHGYLATAELLLDDLTTAAITPAADVSEATLRGVAAFRRGDRRRASGHFAEARTLLRKLSDETTRADLQFRLAIAEAGSGMQPASSMLADLDAGIATQSEAEHSIWLPPLLTERGVAFERGNEPARAEADYRRAIEVLESREPRIDQTTLALGITAPAESPFDRAIRLFMQQGRIDDALSIAERAGALRISALHARGARVRDVYRPLRDRGDGVAEARQALRAGEIAVAHYLLRDELIAWVITKDAVRAVRRPVQREELLRHAVELQQCRAQACDAAVDALSAALLQPWIETVPRGATLLLLPAAELEAVPFAMLETAGGERLVQRNATATVPKLRAFAQAVKQDAARAGEVTAFFAAAASAGGDLAPLPRAIPEVTNASARYPRAAVEPHATRARFLAESPLHSIVHFAGHIVVDPMRPLFSALVFDGGELLYVHELDERSFAKARLIVLSACDSGRSPRPAMSIANALLSQNVPSVVYTYRAVDDQVAEAFALELHRALSSGKTRAEAVNEAQRSLMRTRPDDASAWAAFALAGVAGAVNESEAEKEED